MFKLVVRVGLCTFAGLGCCCIVEPEAPLSLLKGYFESRESTAEIAANPNPKIDLAVVNATLAMLNRQSPASPEGVAPPVQLDAANKRLDDMFFSDADSKAEATIQSKIKIPFLSGDSEQKFEPVDVGATIQSNPFLSK